jgi:hypothetical protein
MDLVSVFSKMMCVFSKMASVFIKAHLYKLNSSLLAYYI